jgi:hypothetical protein
MEGKRARVAVELWVEPTAGGEYAVVVERLRELVDAGRVDGFVVRTWDRYLDAAFDPRDGRRRPNGPRAPGAARAARRPRGGSRRRPRVAVTPSGRGPRCMLAHLATVDDAAASAPPTAAP